MIVTVVEGNLIKNTIVNLQEEINDEELLNLNILLNTNLNGLTTESQSALKHPGTHRDSSGAGKRGERDRE